MLLLKKEKKVSTWVLSLDNREGKNAPFQMGHSGEFYIYTSVVQKCTQVVLSGI